MSNGEDEVPGMADAIERRMAERGLSPTTFATAAGVTLQGLYPLRKGYRRHYQSKLKLGVAKALDWPPDAIDRLLAGELVEVATSDDRLTQIEDRLQRLEEQVDEMIARLSRSARQAR